ncbi:putative zinc finger in N-recognin-domain-containing protein [Paraphysoderma sedebokerense]|nr:putative zinc finger in N-recognin-domain-containing protein [Paraphysoderma sedebokerense]
MMSSSDKSDANVNQDSKSDTITALDYLETFEAQTREAEEALPYKFDKCTYDKGYATQPVYACLTCTPDKYKGFCYSCSIMCHTDHQVIELFQKRQFKCDCGDSEMPGTCELQDKKILGVNSENRYNHNFAGEYCWCDGVYDPDEEAGTMFQCAVCQDWYHDRCISEKSPIPSLDLFDEFICESCVDKYPVLLDYSRLTRDFLPPTLPISESTESEKKSAVESQSTGGEEVDRDPASDGKETTDAPSSSTPEKFKRLNSSTPGTSERTPKRQKQCPSSGVASPSIVASSPTSAAHTDSDFHSDPPEIDIENGNIACKRSKLNSNLSDEVEVKAEPRNLFCVDGWRQKLCQCNECRDLFESLGIGFLLYEEEVVEFEKDDDAGSSLYESGLTALGRMDRVQAIEGIKMVDALGCKLKEWLRGFADRGEVVTEDAVKQFWSRMAEEREEARQLL